MTITESVDKYVEWLRTLEDQELRTRLKSAINKYRFGLADAIRGVLTDREIARGGVPRGRWQCCIKVDDIAKNGAID